MHLYYNNGAFAWSDRLALAQLVAPIDRAGDRLM